MTLKSIIISFKDKLLSNKLYLFGFLGALLIFLLIIIYFSTRPERPDIPSVPRGSWAQDLVSYWAFDEKKGQITYDALAGQNNGRLGSSDGVDSADPQRVKKGKINRALKFDGQDDYVVVLNHPSLNISKEISIEGWFKVLGSASPIPQPTWLPDFQYRKQIIVDNTESRESFENFQLSITLDTAALIGEGKMQINCQDIRITDSDETTLLFHWLESGCNTKETKIWVKVLQLPARLTKNLYLYYGNPQATAKSDFYKTMETPPIKWWDYPLSGSWQGREIKALALGTDNYIIAVGSDKYEGNLRWHMEMINSRGSGGSGYNDNPSSGADEINNTAVDLKGNIILAGYDFTPGNSQWRARKWGGEGWIFTSNFSPDSDEIKAVAVDSENNVLLAGYDSVPGNAQWHLVKLNTDGKKLLDYTINPSDQTDVIVDVAADSRNNIILGGYEKSLGNDRWRIEKLDPEGGLLYSYRLGVADVTAVLNAIAIDSKDNVIAVGYDSFPGDAQWRMLKLDPEGKRLWQWSYNPSPGFDEIKAVAVDEQDNFIVAGYDSVAGDFGWQMMKFSPAGEKIWEWSYNPSGDFDELKDMVVDSENNIILAGYDLSFTADPHWRVVKFSERKPVFPQPKVDIKEERTAMPLANNIILAKPNSYQISATPDQIVGFINKSSIPANLRSQDWNHFLLTYDGTRQKLYLNGSLANNKALTGEISTYPNNLYIGYNFAGIIDELKIYNRALSPEEAVFLYNKK